MSPASGSAAAPTRGNGLLAAATKRFDEFETVGASAPFRLLALC